MVSIRQKKILNGRNCQAFSVDLVRELQRKTKWLDNRKRIFEAYACIEVWGDVEEKEFRVIFDGVDFNNTSFIWGRAGKVPRWIRRCQTWLAWFFANSFNGFGSNRATTLNECPVRFWLFDHCCNNAVWMFLNEGSQLKFQCNRNFGFRSNLTKIWLKIRSSLTYRVLWFSIIIIITKLLDPQTHFIRRPKKLTTSLRLFLTIFLNVAGTSVHFCD